MCPLQTLGHALHLPRMPPHSEDEPLPGDWKRMPEFERLLLFRALRPDRLTAAMKKFGTIVIGAK